MILFQSEDKYSRCYKSGSGMKEYRIRLNQIEKELETASGITYILLSEEKEQIEYLILRAV